MFNIGFFKMLRDLIGMLGGFISAVAKLGNAADELATVAEESAALFAEEVKRSRQEAAQKYLESRPANE